MALTKDLPIISVILKGRANYVKAEAAPVPDGIEGVGYKYGTVIAIGGHTYVASIKYNEASDKERYSNSGCNNSREGYKIHVDSNIRYGKYIITIGGTVTIVGPKCHTHTVRMKAEAV